MTGDFICPDCGSYNCNCFRYRNLCDVKQLRFFEIINSRDNFISDCNSRDESISKMNSIKLSEDYHLTPKKLNGIF